MAESTPINRRQFLKTTGITAGAVLITGAAGFKSAQWAFSDPVETLHTQTIEKGNSMNKILVAYATKSGSTAEIAKVIGDLLGEKDSGVTSAPVQEIKSITPYTHIILGTALRFEKPIHEMLTFVNRFQSELEQKPIACFSVGVYMKEDSVENREKTFGFLTPLLEKLPQPQQIGLFGGKVDYAAIAPFWRFLVSMDRGGLMSEGDWRDWSKIKRWTDVLAAAWGI